MSHRSQRQVTVVGSGWMFTSGISYYTYHLACALEGSHRVSVLLMRRLIPRIFYPGKLRVGQKLAKLQYPSRVSVFDGIDWYLIPSIFKAVQSLRQNKPEIVVFQWWTGAVLHSYLMLLLVARKIGAKVVVEFHETQDTGETKVRGAARYLQLVGGLLVGSCDGFVVHSEFDRDAVLSTFGLGGKPFRVIPHGPYDHHTSMFESETAAALQRSEPVTLLFFGTIRPYKGLEHLVEAFNGLNESESERFHLIIVGETWEGWDEPLALARTGPHADKITVVNRYVADEEIGPYFEQADLVVLPYTRSSASGPLHIAMAHGVPVAVTRVGGLIESAGDYEGTIWLEPSDPEGIRRLLLQVAKRGNKRFSDPRSWQMSCELFSDLFDELQA